MVLVKRYLGENISGEVERNDNTESPYGFGASKLQEGEPFVTLTRVWLADSLTVGLECLSSLTQRRETKSGYFPSAATFGRKRSQVVSLLTASGE